MIFNALYDAARRSELILVDGGMCHWHLRRDGVLTIREIIVLPGRQGQGIGTAMLAQLRAVPGAKAIRAKCPGGLPANAWYRAMGFEMADAAGAGAGCSCGSWRYDHPQGCPHCGDHCRRGCRRRRGHRPGLPRR